MNLRYFCEDCEVPLGSVPDDADEPILCHNCHQNRAEAAYDRQQQRLMEDGPGPTLLEQQIEAYKIKKGLK